MISFIIVTFLMQFFIFDFKNLSLDIQGLIFVLCILSDINILLRLLFGDKN